MLWWRVNYSGKWYLRGHPGHSRAGLALRCSRHHACISTPMFHVSAERVIYTCMNVVGGTYSLFWTVTAHCSRVRVGRGNQ